jgi:hypothetical protein
MKNEKFTIGELSILNLAFFNFELLLILSLQTSYTLAAL